MTGPYRIAMIAACPFPSPRGSPVRIQRMAEALATAGHEVHVVTYHLGIGGSAAGLHLHRTPGLLTYRRDAPGPSLQKLVIVDPLLVLQLIRVIRRVPVDLIHAHHYEGLLVARSVARWSKHPVIYDAHTMLESELPYYLPSIMRPAARRIGRWLDGLLPRGANHVIAVSSNIRDKLLAAGAARPDSITVVANGVEQSHFQAGLPVPRNHPSGKLIFTGNLAPYQGIELLLRAFGQIRRQDRNVRLMIVTDSSFAPYETLARELGVRDAVEVLPGGYDDLPHRLAEADIALNPRTLCDGVPLKLLNYMSAAKPIVSFAGSAHFLEDRRTGRVVPDGDVEAFAQAVLDLLAHPDRAERLGQNARRHSDEHFSWPNAAVRIESVYQQVLAESRRSRVPAPPPTQVTV